MYKGLIIMKRKLKKVIEKVDTVIKGTTRYRIEQVLIPIVIIFGIIVLSYFLSINIPLEVLYNTN